MQSLQMKLHMFNEIKMAPYLYTFLIIQVMFVNGTCTLYSLKQSRYILTE